MYYNRITRNKEFIEYFMEGGRSQKKCGNLYIEGDKLINYGTVLVEFKGDEILVNITKYSTSTSRIQTYIKKELEYARYYRYNIIYKEGVERGTKSL